MKATEGMLRAELQGHTELEGAEAAGAERRNLLETEVPAPPHKKQEGNHRELGECGRWQGGGATQTDGL